MDRSKPGSKVPVLSDRGGLPLAVTVSAAHTHDSQCLEALVPAIPAVCSRRGRHRRRPDKLPLDKGYDYPHIRALLRDRACPSGGPPRRPGEHRLGRYRWVIERTIAWLFGYRRLTLRYERSAKAYCAFLTLAAALTCHKRYLKLTT